MTSIGSLAVEDLRARLIAVARARRTVTYSEVARWAGLSIKDEEVFRGLLALLDRLSHDEFRTAGRPFLSAVVVNGKTREPGVGLTDLAVKMNLTDRSDRAFANRELRRLHEYWANAPAPGISGPE